KVAGEIDRLKEAARSYRLLGTTSENEDVQRLVHSGVDEIHEATQFALQLLRSGLGLQTAVLLGVERRGESLSVLEVSSDVGEVASGLLGARDGIFGAVLARTEPVAVSGPRAASHASHYKIRPPVGALCAVPVVEHGTVRGLLVVDRAAHREFEAAEIEALR